MRYNTEAYMCTLNKFRRKRHEKKKIIAAMMSAAMLFSVVTPYLPVQAEEGAAVLQETDAEAERETINFNTDWHYHKGDAAGADQAAFADDGWIYVNLPHSTDFYDADNKDAYLGVSWYRKDFTPDPSLEGKELLLTFEAAMQKAEVYLNGEKIMTHEGGYSPFVIDLTGLVNYGETNVIAVKIDSSPNTNFAPGKTNPDFQYWGGIYGEAYLTVKDPVHITDAVEADTTAGGGVFITAPEVGTESAVVKVKTQVENLSGEEQNVTLRTEILNEDGTEAASQESTEEIGSAEASDFTHVLTVDDPRLWSTYTPELYTVRTTVYVDGVKKDSVDTTYGIRKVEWKRDGLYVNDVLTKVNGANLHSETYMVGNAMTESAIYAEVKQFKENGFDFVRMSHYPHVQAFYDACDKYGVMVLECASGWQYFNNTDAFKNSTYEELRTTIRSHRNHPSIMAWETSLNESNYNAAWAKEMNRIAKEEYPTDGVSYAWTAGCIQWDAWDIGLGTPQANIFKSGAQGAENPAYADKPIIVAEYGDWTYGGSNSSTRVTREKENSYGKKGGDEGMLIQCDNIQESVALMNSEDYVGASMFWDYADYAGFDAGMLTYCGVVDLSRIEKHSAYFFRSQRDPEVDMSEYGVETGPMVYIANLWDSAADNSEVRVFSNCDEVALYYNDELVAVQGHDETMWGPHGDTSESGSPGSGAGKEISTENLEYPPVTFDLSAYTAGEGTLRAVGLIDGEEAAEYVRKAPGEAASVQLRPQDDSALKLDGSDARLVWIDIADADGTGVTDAYTDVDLSITGPGLIVGPKTVQTRGGQLAVWVKSKRGEGEITLTAPEPVKVEAGTAPEDMELPENVLVTLEDGAQAAVPVEWDLTSLSVEGNTGTMTGTARAIPGIIMEDTETTLTIQYTESAQPVRIQLLQAAYDLVKDADLTDVVESIVELYNERISAAEALLARAEAGDPALTQEEVDQSVEDLIEIVQYLSFTGNKDELEKVITAAQEMEAELDKYLEKGQAEFLAALETAENVMADGDALQEEINDVMLQLVKGMADLRLRPDKSLLEELLKEANGKNKESYTEESYQNLLSAISVADAAYSNLEADQEEVDGAAELLRAAIDSLEPAGFPDPENPDPETPGTGTSDPEPESPVSDPEDSNTGKPEGNSSDAGTQSSSLDGKKTASASGNASDAGNGNAQSAAKAVRTGDNAHPAIYAAVLLALAAGAGYTVCGRRKKK